MIRPELLDRYEKVQGKLRRKHAKRADKGERIILAQSSQQHNACAKRKQSKCFDSKRKRKILTHRNDLGAEFVRLEYLHEISHRGKAAQAAEHDQSSGLEDQHKPCGHAKQHAKLAQQRAHSAALGCVQNREHARAVFPNAKTDCRYRQQDCHEHIAVGIGKIAIPANGIFILDLNQCVYFIDPDQISLIAVFIRLLTHARGKIILLRHTGSSDHAPNVGFIRVKLLQNPVRHIAVPIFRNVR